MGRKKKDFTDKFKIEVAKEDLKKRAMESEIAAKYNIAPGTLTEWIFLRDYRSEEEPKKLLGDFVRFFNKERIHYRLNYKKTDEVYKEGSFPSVIIKKMAA